MSAKQRFSKLYIKHNDLMGTVFSSKSLTLT